MPLIATRGAASAQGFGEFAQTTAPVYIEDVFSTWLYTGNGSTQTITNGIDLAGKGGLVWVKGRSGSFGTGYHLLQDSSRGFGNSTALSSNATDAQYSSTGIIQSVSSTGFTSGASGLSNASSTDYASWTFRKAEKFFDVVTYTGDGVAGRTVSHNLGSTPGCIIVKRTDVANNWVVYHRSIGATQYGRLDLTVEFVSAQSMWNNTEPTQNNFTVGFSSSVNTNGGTYVAYLFAHNAGGFGLTGSDNVISCGSYTGNGSTTGPTVTLGYEPQWVLIKRTDSTGDWILYDTMRGLGVKDATPAPYLRPNTSGAEVDGSQWIAINATGFNLTSSYGDLNVNTATYIYIAIRRGPMKTPTSGTSVFDADAQAGAGTVTTNFPVDLSLSASRGAGFDRTFIDRLRGGSTTSYAYLASNSTAAEATGSGAGIGLASNTTLIDNWWSSGQSIIYYNFRRAPGFFDVVCYTGNGTSNRAITHNLGVAPEMVIIKFRNDVNENWFVWNLSMGGYYMALNTNGAQTNTNIAQRFGNGSTYIAPSSTQLTLGSNTQVNYNTGNFVAYLFATVAGVSKVGSYTGTGALQTVNCGFTGGARFVLIKRTDSTGDWWVYDSARGISSGNDPYLFLNDTAAEVTGTNYVDTTSVGFQVTAAAPAGLNANGGTYIFLAIA